jgi:hypothetical protein
MWQLYVGLLVAFGALIWMFGAAILSAVVAAGTFLLAGGWFAGETWSLGMALALGLIVLIPSIGIGVLTEWGDPSVRFWWEDQDRTPSTHEIVTSMLCIGLVFVLNWGGIPIWAEVKAHPVLVPTAYFVLGTAWMFYLWDSFSKYLHKQRTKRLQLILGEVEETLRSLAEIRRDIRKTFGLGTDAPLITSTNTLSGGSGREYEHAQRLLERHKEVIKTIHQDFLSEEDKTSEEISDQEIERLIAMLAQKNENEVNLAAPFQQYFEYKAKNIAEVSAADHLGQLYLWMFFWPWSFSLRMIRKIVTLRFLRDIFVAFFNSFRPLFDRIAARHKAKIVISSNDGPTAPPSSGGKEDDPVAAELRQQKIRHFGGTRGE